MKLRRLSFTFSLLLFLSLLCAPSLFATALDASFGAEGWVTTSVGHFDDKARAVAVQPDGRIVLGGSSSNLANDDFALVRYNSDGKLDTAFNLDGRVVTDLGGSDDQVSALALMEDGRIVAAGYTHNGTDSDFALARYKADGSLDATFGARGIVTLSLQHGDEAITALAVQEDGGIIAAGFVSGTMGRVTALLRFLPNGFLDQTFGDAGMAMVALGSDAVTNDLAVLEDGRIIAAGSHLLEKQSRLQLLSFLADGRLDESFGNKGIAETVIVDEATSGNSLWVQEDGSILVAGSVGEEQARDIALFSYLATGVADSSFAAEGLLRTDVHGEEDAAHDVLVSAEAILLTGFATFNGQRDFVLLQYTSGEAGDTGESDTLRIRDLVVEDLALEADVPGTLPEGVNLEEQVLVTEISRLDDASYGFALLENNMLVAAGDSDDSGIHSFALARYLLDEEAAGSSGPGLTSAFINTTAVTEVTRVGAYTGGTIIPGSGFVFSKRGVVFSVAPYPSLRGDGNVSSPVDNDVNPFTKVVVTSGQTDDGTGPGQYNSILSGLTAGTLYYVRAYGATAEGDIYYGNQLSFETEDACFIATAAYGSFLHPSVRTLRLFRDRYMKSNAAGRTFVRLYYHYSPPLADLIGTFPVLRQGVRVLLLPLVGMSSLCLYFGQFGLLFAILALLTTGLVFVRGVRKEKMAG